MGRFRRQFGMRQESKYSKAIIGGDGYDPLRCHAFPIVTRLRAVAGNEPAAVKVNHHWQPLLTRAGRSPDVQVETIFAHTVGAKSHVAENGSLHATRTELRGLTHTIPVLDWLGLFPPETTSRRLCKWDPFECTDAGFLSAKAFDHPGRDRDAVGA